MTGIVAVWHIWCHAALLSSTVFVTIGPYLGPRVLTIYLVLVLTKPDIIRITLPKEPISS